MSAAYAEYDRGRSPRQHRECPHNYSPHVDKASHHSRRNDHKDRVAVLKNDQSRRRSHSETRHNLRVGEYNPRHSRSIARPESTGGHRDHEPSHHIAARDKAIEKAAEKAISAAAAAVFHLREERGSWMGEKGVKVLGAAAAAALIDGLLNSGSEHAVHGFVVSCIDKAVGDSIVNGSSVLDKIL